MSFRVFPIVLASFVSVAAIAAQTEDRATVQLRDGSKVEGRIEALGNGTLFLRVSLADQRRIPVANVALIDRVGGASGLPDTETGEARQAEHVLLLSSGGMVKGQLIQIRGGEGSGDEGPRSYIFRTSTGDSRTYPPEQVARIYLGSYPFEPAVRTGEAAPVAERAFVPAGGVRVPATAAWVPTGITVRQGDAVSFDTSGEVQLSSNPADRAGAAGTTRTARLAPLPEANAGALIGRIGRNGRPFGIGDQSTVPMPEAGVLFLAVNDDERSDNAGEFIVVVNRRR